MEGREVDDSARLGMKDSGEEPSALASDDLSCVELKNDCATWSPLKTGLSCTLKYSGQWNVVSAD